VTFSPSPIPAKKKQAAPKAARRKKIRVRVQGISLLLMLASPYFLYHALQGNNTPLAVVSFALVFAGMLATILVG
jgi:hypothetical protein